MVSQTPPSLRLLMQQDAERRSIPITGRTVIGRLAKCDLRLAGDGISREHASIVPDGSTWKIIDLNSANGVYVNGRRVASSELGHGDKIRIGTANLVCEIARDDRERVLIDETDMEPLLSASIDMNAFGRNAGLGVACETDRPAGIVPASRPGSGKGDTIDTWARSAGNLGLFRSLSEALLSGIDLDGVLDRVIELAFARLPAERGFIGLYDQDADRLTARRVRTRDQGATETIRISSQIAHEAIRGRRSVLVEDTSSDGRFDAGASIAQLEIRSAMCAPLCCGERVIGLVYIDSRDPERRFEPADLEVFSTLAVVSAIAIEKARLADEIESEQRIRAHLARYHAPAVVTRIVEAARTRNALMVAEEREVSVLFLDLCGFTALSEKLPPAAVTRMLNDVFALLTEAVFQFDGTLDKFTGDGMMVFFGAPIAQPDHALHAVQAALAMRTFLERFNAGRTGPPLEMRVGINSGSVIAGDVGAPQRRDYTVIGDAVNVASRLESSVAQPGWIVVGPATHALLAGRIACEALPAVQLKGKSASLVPYRVLATGS